MAGDYREASLRIWEDMAAGWEGDRASVWDATHAIGEWLVDALDPQPGETVLELAAGVGDTGYTAARRLGAEGRADHDRLLRADARGGAPARGRARGVERRIQGP